MGSILNSFGGRRLLASIWAGEKMVNAIKLYVIFDRVGCISFKVFTV
jgi:hypothetical protein